MTFARIDPTVEEKVWVADYLGGQIDGFGAMRTPNIHLNPDEQMDQLAPLVLNKWQAETPSFLLCKPD
jgi:hypothetical protein